MTVKGSRLQFVCALLILPGCGDPLFSEQDQASSLFTLNGKLTSDGSLEVSDSIRVALVWAQLDHDQPEPGRVFVAQTVEVAALSFPATFTLELNELPPAGVLASWSDLFPSAPPESRYAFGMVVAFEDLDGDDELTLPDLTTADLPDKIVGVSGEEEFLLYQEGQVPQEILHDSGGEGDIERLDGGFNVLIESPDFVAAKQAIDEADDECEAEAGSDWDALEACWETWTAQTNALQNDMPRYLNLGSGAAVEVEVMDAPQAAERFCPDYDFRYEDCDDEGHCPTGTSGLCDWCVYDGSIGSGGSCTEDRQCTSGSCAAGQFVCVPTSFLELECSEDGLTASWRETAPDTHPAICINTGFDARVQFGPYADPDALPDWWPCEVEP